MSALRTYVLDCAAALDAAIPHMADESPQVQRAIQTRRDEKQRVYDDDEHEIWTSEGCPKNPQWFNEWAEDNYEVLTRTLQGAENEEVRHQVTEARKSMYKAKNGSR